LLQQPACDTVEDALLTSLWLVVRDVSVFTRLGFITVFIGRLRRDHETLTVVSLISDDDTASG